MERNKTMKNKHITIVALAAAALATSCASEDIAEPLKQEQNQGEPKTVTLTASVNEAQTRVGMTKDGSKASFYWHAKDAISVLTKKSDGTFSGTEFTITGDDVKDGEASATFTGEVTGTVGGYAVYPYSENQKHSFTGEKALTYVLPASYDSYTVGSNIFSNTTPTNIPMLGTIADGKVSFKCLGGLAVIRIDQMPATSGTLTVAANEQLSGDFTVSDLSASDAQIATTTASDDNGKVTFTFSGASTTGAGVFYLPLATGDYTNVKVTIGETEVDCGSVSISRAGITAVSIATYSGTLDNYSDKLLRSYGNSKYYVGSNKYLINDHEFVDLGLSVLWATMNVGATSATEYGSRYGLSYATSTISSSWGSGVSVPTKDEFNELINGCDRAWGEYDSKKGHTFTCKTNSSNSIFLPAAGNSSGGYDGTYGYYWSSTADTQYENSAYAFEIDRNSCYITNSYDNTYTYSVRPVAAKP